MSEENAWPAVDDLFEHAPCGLLVTGADGMIRRVNATFCSWTGYSEQELVGVRRVSELLTMGGRVVVLHGILTRRIALNSDPPVGPAFRFIR